MADENSVKFPPRNLPGSSEIWGRKIEETTRELKRSVKVLDQSLNNSDRSTAGQLETNSKQLIRLDENVNFLLTQASSESKPTIYETQYSPANASFDTVLSYDSTYDPQVQIIVPESGSFRVDASCKIYAYAKPDAGSYVRTAPGHNLYVESASKDVTVGEFLYNAASAGANGPVVEANTTVSAFYTFINFTPGETCTITLRRKWRGDAGGTLTAATMQFGRWSYPSLSTTLIR